MATTLYCLKLFYTALLTAILFPSFSSLEDAMHSMPMSIKFHIDDLNTGENQTIYTQISDFASSMDIVVM